MYSSGTALARYSRTLIQLPVKYSTQPSPPPPDLYSIQYIYIIHPLDESKLEVQSPFHLHPPLPVCMAQLLISISLHRGAL